MSSKNELPAKCRECAKSKVLRFHGKCHFCRELEFHEAVLCDLNRCIQDRTKFQCHAFEPILRLASPSQNRANGRIDRLPKRLNKESYLRLFSSDKIKYERALALQKLSRDPDDVYVQLKYHFAWNVARRAHVFNPPNHFINLVHDIFLSCSERVVRFVDLLYLAPDHIHLYVESDGELSVEEMGHKIKRFSNNTIIEKFPLVRDKFRGDIEIWDEAYFVETVG